MKTKFLFIFLIIVHLFSITTTAFAFVDEKTNSVDIEEKYKILQDYNESLKAKRGIKNNINFLGYAEGQRIAVGITNIGDEYFKNEIVSLPGIDSDSIEFVQFKIEWDSFATELPKNQETTSTRSFTLFMGTAIDMGGGNYATMGSPTNANGTAFYTANRGLIPYYSYVKWNLNTIGVVDGISFGNSTDISRVNMSSYNNNVVNLS